MSPSPPGARVNKTFWRSLTVWASAISGALVLGYGACTALSEVPARADANNAEQVRLGRQIYARECAACHGDKLQGQPNWRRRRPDGRLPAPPHDETGHTWHHSDDVLFVLTKRGPQAFARPGYQSDMPAYGGKLTDREIWSVLAFIKSRWPRHVRERQDASTRRARDPKNRKR